MNVIRSHELWLIRGFSAREQCIMAKTRGHIYIFAVKYYVTINLIHFQQIYLQFFFWTKMQLLIVSLSLMLSLFTSSAK